MTILFVTDIHGRTDIIDRLPRADLLLLGGDLTHFGTPKDAERVLAAFSSRFPCIFAVLGNCDPPSAETILEASGVNLHLRREVHAPLLLGGIGGANATPFGTPFEWPEDEFRDLLPRVLSPVSPVPSFVLVSHAPPAGSGADRLPNGRCVGSEAVADFVRAVHPALVLCGHIHEGRGEFDFMGTRVVNPGPFRQGFFAEITFPEGGSAQVTLSRIED